MTKYLLALVALLFSGCYFTFNTAMCNQIASDPNAVMPQECRDYNEDEAEKAFNPNKIKTDVSDEELLEFHKQQEEE